MRCQKERLKQEAVEQIKVTHPDVPYTQAVPDYRNVFLRGQNAAGDCGGDPLAGGLGLKPIRFCSL
jgi:hypothetical protein